MTERGEALLVFEDGTVYRGKSFGAIGETFGEVVFNTAMTGYQEILTDPSYRGQIVMMTYPLIGNYGVNPIDVESKQLYANGFIVRELSSIRSNHRSTMDLHDWLAQHGVVGIEDVDTRAIVRKLRIQGTLRAVISSRDLDVASLTKKVLASPKIVGADIAKQVTRATTDPWTEPYTADFRFETMRPQEPRYKVVAYDFGIKQNIMRSLVVSGFDVTVVPAQTSAKDVIAMRPDAVFLSNGPGDPEPCEYAIEAVRRFLGERIPFFGICLGHQITGLALGGRTYKMKFGHHGANHPVIDLTTRKTEITSQNHSFAVDPASLDSKRARVSHESLYDGTCEGIEVLDAPAFSVQYHPEAAPGPHDAMYLFERFRALIAKHKASDPKASASRT